MVLQSNDCILGVVFRQADAGEAVEKLGEEGSWAAPELYSQDEDSRRKIEERGSGLVSRIYTDSEYSREKDSRSARLAGVLLVVGLLDSVREMQ